MRPSHTGTTYCLHESLVWFCLYGNDILVKSRKAPATVSKQSLFKLEARFQEGL